MESDSEARTGRTEDRAGGCVNPGADWCDVDLAAQVETWFFGDERVETYIAGDRTNFLHEVS